MAKARGVAPEQQEAPQQPGGLPVGDAGGLTGRMGGMPEGEEGAPALDERQLDALVEGIQEIIFGGDTEDGVLSKEMQDMLVAHADAPHGGPEIAAQVASQILNAAVRGAEAQGVILEANVVMYGAMVAVDKTIEVMEGETGMSLTDDEVGQAFMKTMELSYDLLSDMGIFSQRDAQAVMDEIRADPAAFDAEVMDIVGPETVDAVAMAMGQGGVTQVPEYQEPEPGGPPPQGAPPA